MRLHCPVLFWPTQERGLGWSVTYNGNMVKNHCLAGIRNHNKHTPRSHSQGCFWSLEFAVLKNSKNHRNNLKLQKSEILLWKPWILQHWNQQFYDSITSKSQNRQSHQQTQIPTQHRLEKKALNYSSLGRF